VVSPSINVLPLSSLAGQWLPSLGVLLAVAGVLLVYAGKTESPTALVPPLGASARALSEDSTDSTGPRRQWDGAALIAQTPGVAALSMSRHHLWSQAWGGGRHGSRKTDTAVQAQSGVAANSLEVGIASGRRAESAHVGTIPLHLRGSRAHIFLMEMAAAQRRDGVRLCQCRAASSD
jgi:hypothetical protein